ncbi:MAG TPA: hypothetical protein VHS52_02555 [Acidimicrobiales bacterium]|jgi:hypothetical protein|nr:hypothetical protein [Acidimicrobiales bacterium]
MAEQGDELVPAVSDLDDAYLKVLLLVAIRRATSEEPRRAGFWHGLAAILAAEQEKRRGVAQLGDDEPFALQPDELPELQTLVADLRADLETVEAEYQESYGQTPPPAGS